MDYSELVKDLRYCADMDTYCTSCKYFDENCEQKLIAKAADAIVELQATLCNWCAVCPEDKRDLSTCEIYESCRAKPPKEETE